ncbi:MAG: hypothetical protein AMS15_03925 [Planctomycetes bacterium DG_23]|nr:MAG: hypothetical protein AMS15_03925 [Planctomycetes bacterium DG_23]
MNLLVHICCSVCFAGILEDLKRKNLSFTGFFYNPNIHPLIEFRRRLKALKVLLEGENIEVIYNENYGLKDFLRGVDWQDKRCADCYCLRLRKTAQVAKERGFSAFTTTLLASPHQEHSVLRRIGEKVSEETEVPFAYFDFRGLHQCSLELAKKKGLYHQKYCGCIFSEYERFKDTTLHLYRGPGGQQAK